MHLKSRPVRPSYFDSVFHSQNLFSFWCLLSLQLSYFLVYEVEVYTGDKRGSGTDAHVFVTIFGDNGQTPRVQLVNRYFTLITADLTILNRV